MKRKTTRKWIASNYTCYGTGYGDLQYLLHFQDADFYTCGVYGWNFDVYTFGKYAITTGYRNMVHHVETQWELEKEYEEKARQIIYSDIDFDEQKKQVNKLLKEFLEKVFDSEVWVYRVA